MLTHIARNADGLANLLNTAATGEVTPMYESDAKRNADIEAGSSRPVAEQLADLRESAGAVRRRVRRRRRPPTTGTRRCTAPRAPTPIPAYQVPAKRLGEVLIHHVDLDADFTPAHWSDTFTDELVHRHPGPVRGPTRTSRRCGWTSRRRTASTA